jgi:hypothetical protein
VSSPFFSLAEWSENINFYLRGAQRISKDFIVFTKQTSILTVALMSRSIQDNQCLTDVNFLHKTAYQQINFFYLRKQRQWQALSSKVAD